MQEGAPFCLAQTHWFESLVEFESPGARRAMEQGTKRLQIGFQHDGIVSLLTIPSLSIRARLSFKKSQSEKQSPFAGDNPSLAKPAQLVSATIVRSPRRFLPSPAGPRSSARPLEDRQGGSHISPARACNAFGSTMRVHWSATKPLRKITGLDGAARAWTVPSSPRPSVMPSRRRRQCRRQPANNDLRFRQSCEPTDWQ